MIPEFPHHAPPNYSYEFETFNSRTIAIWLHCQCVFDYNLGKPTRTIWGFYSPNKRIYYAPVNAKTIGKEVSIKNTTPYSAMQLKQTPLESAYV